MVVLDTWFPFDSCDFNLQEEVHIWKVQFPASSTRFDKYRSFLSGDEIQRAQRFHFEKDRARYIITRGQLRYLLGKYLNREAKSLTFTYNKYGKPALSDFPIHFNVSHSYEMGLLIFDSKYEVGIDIEWMRKDFGGLKIAERFFSPDEINELKMLPEAQQLQAFFNCWSRKEAYIKALGKGLSIPLAKFSVTLSPGKEAVLLSTTHEPQALYTYRLVAILADPDYAAAAVVHIGRKQIKLFNTIDNQCCQE